MKERPLRIPIVLDPKRTEQDGRLPIQPTHIASWISIHPFSDPPLRYLALATLDNNIWITTAPITDSNRSPTTPASSQPTPQIVVPSPSKLAEAGPSRLNRPRVPRSISQRGRPRAASNASSILSSVSSGRRKVSAFSPPSSSINKPTATLTSVASDLSPTENPSTSIPARHSFSDTSELIDHLRTQASPTSPTDDSRSNLGLGIAGLGRRGLVGVHSQSEIKEHSGLTSPKSTQSVESGSRSISQRILGWKDDESGKEKERARELMEQVQEVEVEREMEREVEEEKKEIEDEKLVEEAKRSLINTPIEEKDVKLGEVKKKVMRIILNKSNMGKIVDIKVSSSKKWLYVLRDTGLLDTVNLETLTVGPIVHLEAEETSTQASSSKTPFRLVPFWQWQEIHFVNQGGEEVVAASGIPWPCGLPSPNGEVTRVVMLRQTASPSMEIVSRLELPGEGAIGIFSQDKANRIMHLTKHSLTSYLITSPPTAVPLTAVPQNSYSNSPNLASANDSPLLRDRSFHQLQDAADMNPSSQSKEKDRSLARFLNRKDKDGKASDVPKAVSWGIEEGIEINVKGINDWKELSLRGNQGIVLVEGAIDMFELDGATVKLRGTITFPPGLFPKQITFEEDWSTVTVCNGARSLVYKRNAEKVGDDGMISWSLLHTFEDASYITSSGNEIILRHKDTITAFALDTGVNQKLCDLAVTSQPRAVDSLVALDAELCFVADEGGNITKKTLKDLLQFNSSQDDSHPTVDRQDARVTSMHILTSSAGVRYLAAGDTDGALRIWKAETFDLLGVWTLFAWPVSSIAILDKFEGHLKDSILCVSEAGTVAVVSTIEMEQSFLIPASRVALRRLFIGGHDIMLAYANGKARVWNFETQEFRRSTGLDAAEDMLNAGKWKEVDFQPTDAFVAVETRGPSILENSDMGRELEIDLRGFMTFLTDIKSSMSSSPLSSLRTMLSMLLTYDTDGSIDLICEEHLGIARPKSAISAGILTDSARVINMAEGEVVWQISSTHTGLRQMAIVALLRPFLDSPDHERWAAQVIAFYTASLPSCAIDADLAFFAQYYLDSSHDIHQAARMLFDSRLDRMSESEIEIMVDSYIAELPSFLPSSDRELESSDMALTILGGTALHKYQSLNPSALKAIADSVYLYLNSTINSHLLLAIELASKGFMIWQTYIDPAEMLRRLFYLSTTTHSSSATIPGSQISAQARLAVLHVASSNPALFMSTLSMDILDAKTSEGRKSIMKLCVYMARKKPQVLENSLPKVIEAVVHSLDPNVAKMREDVQQTATVILNELVLAFSTVDFHSSTQKLAVGTHEGAVIMYDLKTASRLYILEPHRQPVSAIMFSPDGRRLLTVSLEEGDLTVWKIGSSLSGFFNVGGPPRQGNKPGEPFKRLEFARVDNVPLASTSALSDVQISWPGPRQARVVIQETAITLET